MKRILIVLLASTSILSAQGLSSLLGGSNAKKIQGVAVKASLGCTNGQILKYVSANSQFECADDSGGSGAGDVEGGTNLTTAGAIPYVSASGTLNQDTPALHWDATNNRLGLGTASPGYPLHILGGAGSLVHVTNGTYSLSLDPSQGAFQGSANVSFLSGSSSDLFFGASSGTYKLTIKNSANSVGIGPSNTSPTGTLHVYDATGGTGDTIVNIRDGAAAAARINFAPNSSATADLGLRHSSANNLGITNGSSTTYWTLGAGGILAGTDNTYDIGASGANRPRNVYVATHITAGGDVRGASLGFGAGGEIKRTGDGIFVLYNALNTNFSALEFGGTTNSYNQIARDAVNGFSIQSAAGTSTFNDASTSASGTVSNRYLFGIAAPTLTATNASTTNTVASTVYIGGAPTASTNVTVGTAWALNVAAGNSNFGGDIVGSSTSCIYLGASGDDGSWRFCRSGNDLVVSRRESSSWVAKGTWAP